MVVDHFIDSFGVLPVDSNKACGGGGGYAWLE